MKILSAIRRHWVRLKIRLGFLPRAEKVTFAEAQAFFRERERLKRTTPHVRPTDISIKR